MHLGADCPPAPRCVYLHVYLFTAPFLAFSECPQNAKLHARNSTGSSTSMNLLFLIISFCRSSLRSLNGSRAHRRRRRRSLLGVGHGQRHRSHGRSWRRRSRVGLASVVLHVRSDEMSCGERTAERELASKDGRTDDAGQATGVVTGVRGVRAAHTEHVKHGALRFENCTTTERPDLERGHGH